MILARTAEDVSAIANVATAFAALFTLIAAVKGLELWRRQLIGSEEYQIAKSMLTTAYRLQSSSQRYRALLSLSADAFPKVREATAQDIVSLWPEYLAASATAKAIWNHDKDIISDLQLRIGTLFALPTIFELAVADLGDSKYDDNATRVISELEKYLCKHLKKPSSLEIADY